MTYSRCQINVTSKGLSRTEREAWLGTCAPGEQDGRERAGGEKGADPGVGLDVGGPRVSPPGCRVVAGPRLAGCSRLSRKVLLGARVSRRKPGTGNPGNCKGRLVPREVEIGSGMFYPREKGRVLEAPPKLPDHADRTANRVGCTCAAASPGGRHRLRPLTQTGKWGSRGAWPGTGL